MNVRTKTPETKTDGLSIFDNPDVLDDVKIGELTSVLESRFSTEELVRGNVNTTKATIQGLPKYETARAANTRYQDIINAVGQHEANPSNYKGLKLRMLAELHPYLEAGDRNTVLGLMQKEADDSNKKQNTEPGKRPKTAEDMLKSFNETGAEAQTSAEMQALMAMTTIDIFNSATKQRYDFAKSKGLLKEFGFTDKDGNETGPVYLDAPATLRKKVDAWREDHKGEYIAMSVDQQGQQRFDVKRKPGFRGTIEKIGGGMMTGAHDSAECALAWGAGAMTREGIFLLARWCGLTNRATSEKNSVSLEKGMLAQAAAAKVAAITGRLPKVEQAQVAPLAGPGNGSQKNSDNGKSQQIKVSNYGHKHSTYSHSRVE